MIQFTRGDTKRLKFQILYCDLEPVQHKADSVIFTMRKAVGEPVILQKNLTSGIEWDENTFYYTLTLKSTDTASLDIGEYGFDIQVTLGDTVKTIYVGGIKLTKEYT